MPCMTALLSWPNHPLKARPLNIITYGVRISTCEPVGTQTLRPQQSLSWVVLIIVRRGEVGCQTSPSRTSSVLSSSTSVLRYVFQDLLRTRQLNWLVSIAINIICVPTLYRGLCWCRTCRDERGNITSLKELTMYWGKVRRRAWQSTVSASVHFRYCFTLFFKIFILYLSDCTRSYLQHQILVAVAKLLVAACGS